MATIGLDKLFFARIIENQRGYEDYDTPMQLAKAMSASLSIEVAEASLYADDALSEIAREFKSGKISLGIDDIGIEAAQMLTGASVDNNGVLVSSTEDTPQPVAVGFRAKKANGKYRYYWLYRVLFAAPSTELTTKGDSISFATPKIEGTIMRRNRPDFSGKHPWKVEVDEDGTPTENLLQSQARGLRQATNSLESVIANWYNGVYEPTYSVIIRPTVTHAEVGQSVTLAVANQYTNDLAFDFQWFESDNGTNSGGVSLLSSGPQYTTAAFTAPGTYYYYCVIDMGNRIVKSEVCTIYVSDDMF